MNNRTTIVGIFFQSIFSILLLTGKVTIIAIAWSLKLVSDILGKIAEIILKITLKRS